MTVMLDELIKWILAQYDDCMTNGQRLSISRRIFPEKGTDPDKEENDEQNGDIGAYCKGEVGRQGSL